MMSSVDVVLNSMYLSDGEGDWDYHQTQRICEDSLMLLVVSGPDRVGKSTLIGEIADVLGSENCVIYHHGSPDPCGTDVFAKYRERGRIQTPERKHIIFDRGWPCTYILEQTPEKELRAL